MINENLNFLLWNIENGADEAIDNKPINYFECSKKQTKLKDSLPEDNIKNNNQRDKIIPKQLTPEKLLEVKSLQDLKIALNSFNACSLKTTAMNTVFGDGNPESKIMLIGEAPGADEDRMGIPFVGLSGKLLDKMLASIALSREKNVYISNIIPWRPPGNRTPTPTEVALCLPFIRKHIELINPKILLLLGGSAASALLNTSDAVSRMSGRWFEYSIPETNKKIDALVTFHPAFLLRSASQKKLAWKDMIMLKQKLADLGEI